MQRGLGFGLVGATISDGTGAESRSRSYTMSGAKGMTCSRNSDLYKARHLEVLNLKRLIFF